MNNPACGPGARPALLGLTGEVTTEDLEAVLEGRDPNSGTPLGSPFVDRVDVAGRVVRAVAGFDATFSAPKSLSVWWAFTGDPRLAEAHDVAVPAVIELSGAVRGHDTGPVERWPVASRHRRG